MPSREETLTTYVKEWAHLPLSDDARRAAARLVQERVTETAELSAGERSLLLELLREPTDDTASSPAPTASDDDLGRMLVLLVRGHRAATAVGAVGRSDAAAVAAAELDALATSSLLIAEYGLSTLARSQATAWMVAHDGGGLSPTTLSTIRRLFELDPETAAPAAYATVFIALSAAVVDAGRADIWEEMVARYLDDVAPRVRGEISVLIAQSSSNIIERDSRWFRAHRVLEQAIALLQVARAQGAVTRLADSIAIDLGIAFVHNRDLDERPLLIDLDETVGLLASSVGRESHGELVARFADLAEHLREDPQTVRAVVTRWWHEIGASSADAVAERIVDEILLDLELREGDIEAVRARYDRCFVRGGFAGAEDLIVNVAEAGETDQWVTLLQEWLGFAARDEDRLAIELAILAVRARVDDDHHVLAAQFEQLGGLHALDEQESALVQRLRFIVSHELDLRSTDDDSPGAEYREVAHEDRVAGVPEELYSADPDDRLQALQWIRTSWAFLAAEKNDETMWAAAYAILAEGYTRGVTDADERVRERSVIFARRIMAWNFSRDHEEVVRWADRVVTDTDTLTTPRAVRARCLALFDIEQYSNDPARTEAAAARLDRELEGNHADYAVVLRAHTFRRRIDNSQDSEQLTPLYERCVQLDVEAEHHDEYEQSDWNERIRDNTRWLFVEHQEHDRWDDAVRNAEMYVSRLPDAFTSAVDETLVMFIKDLTAARIHFDAALYARADAVVDAAATRLAASDPALLRQARAKGRALGAAFVWKVDRAEGMAQLESALPEFRAIVDDGEDSSGEIRSLVVEWSRWVFFEAEKWESGELDGSLRPYTLTTRGAVLYLRNGCAQADPASDRLVSSMIRMAASPKTFLTGEDPDEVRELYRLLQQHVNPTRDADYLAAFRKCMKSAERSTEAQSPPRWLATATMILGGVLLLAATLAVLAAPEGTTVSVNGRRGAVQFQAGLWALYFPGITALAAGAIAMFKPEQLGTPPRRSAVLIVVIAIISAVAGIGLIVDALT